MLSTPRRGRFYTKICGVMTNRDSRFVVASGADAIGFNLFSGSKRFLPPEDAFVLARSLKGKVDRVAVVVNPSAAELADLREAACFEAVQFHGDETPAFCAKAGFDCWVKAVRVDTAASMDAALLYQTPYLLLDSFRPGEWGGTGHRLDWDLARDFVINNPDRKVVLAGGLTPANLREALRIVRPFGADVASGVEVEPGKKDEYLVREFVAQAASLAR